MTTEHICRAKQNVSNMEQYVCLSLTLLFFYLIFKEGLLQAVLSMVTYMCSTAMEYVAEVLLSY